MRSRIIDGRGRIIVNALTSTNEISIQVDCGQGQMGAILSPLQAAELNIAVTAALKACERK